MSELGEKLGDHIGIGMAAMMMDRAPEQTGAIYDIIRANNVTVFKIGGVSLMKLKDWQQASGISSDPPWPEELARLPMDYLYSRSQLAAILHVSVGTIHRMARLGDIDAIDLSEWNMNSLYYYPNDKVGFAAIPKIINAWGYKIQATLDDGQLGIEIWPNEPCQPAATCFFIEPDKVWFVDNGDETLATIVFHKEPA